MWEAIGAILAIVLLLLKHKLSAKHKRVDEIQQGRRDIANGNADAVSLRIDTATAGYPAGLSSDQNTARRLEAITGVPRVGTERPSDGQIDRESRTLQRVDKQA